MEDSDFGIFIREKRKAKNLTLKQLAKISGVSQTYITNVENGKRGAPSPEILKKLSAPLGVDYVELMNKADYVSEHLIPQDHFYYVSSKIGAAIVDVLKEIKHTNKFTQEAAQEFHKELIDAIKGADISISDLKRHLYDVEPDGDAIPRIAVWEETGKIENLLALLEKVAEDDINLRLLKREQILAKELSTYLTQNKLTYNGHPLTDQDRQRVLDMLKALFPEYQKPASEPGEE
ncbi:helix-turn-helix domain-containing protein [Paenibacillus wynnii]|uniref:helix-turn-helix domain-containing protein n=1 Tax=Paenibacillus wynnii TaxID=268407 RepID=UPI0006916144|nr:helix-turn-helix domain-containing protein [Paenibacillus wynnii]